MQYTLREIPPTLDSELRQRAKAEGKSLNTVAIEALIRGTGLGDSPVRLRDLSDIVLIARIDDVKSGCKYDKTGVTIDLAVSLLGERGRAGADKGDKAATTSSSSSSSSSPPSFRCRHNLTM